MTLLIQFFQNFFVDVNSAELTDFFLRLAINYISVFILIRYIYYPRNGQQEYFFTFYLTALVVFLIASSLENLRIELGFALGLFAVFSIIRFRTPPFELKEMTYLFVVIGLAVVNSLAGKQISYAELGFINGATVLIVYLLEYVILQSHENSRTIIYEKIELIKPEKREEMKADLEQRTGLQISKISIGKIDFLRDTAQVRIYYHSDDPDEFYPED